MKQSVFILHIDANPDASWFVHRHLRGDEARHIVQHVGSLREFTRAIEEGDWHAVLADFDTPGISATEAVSLLRARDIDVPFLVVSRPLSEAEFSTVLRSGADDWVDRNELDRLLPVLQREFRRRDRAHTIPLPDKEQRTDRI